MRVGDTVIVRKAGDVIPEVVGPVVAKRKRGARRWKFPTHCPVCDQPLVRLEGEADTRCVNVDCPAQRVQRIVFFAGPFRRWTSKVSARSVCAQFVGGRACSPTPPTSTRSTVEQLVPLERIGDRSAQLLIAAIDESRSRPLAKLLVGLGIRHVGPSAAIALARELADLDAIASATTEELSVVPGVGGVIAESVARLLRQRAQPRADREAPRRRGQLPRVPEKVVAPAGGAIARGPDLRAHRHAAGDDARGGSVRARRRAAARSPAACRRRPATSWWARAPARSWRRRSSSASPILDEDGLRHLLEHGPGYARSGNAGAGGVASAAVDGIGRRADGQERLHGRRLRDRERYPGYEFTIERGKIREFARATMSRNPDYLDDPGGRVPPTWLIAVGVLGAARPREPDGVAQHQPRPSAARRPGVRVLRPAAARRARSSPPSRWIDSVYEKEGKRGGTMRFVEMVTEFRDEAGKVVAESRTTMIETGKPPTEEVVMTSWDELHEGERTAAARVRPDHAHRHRALPGRVGRLQPHPPRRGVRAVGGVSRRVFSVGMLQAGILGVLRHRLARRRERASLRGAVPRAGLAGRPPRVLGHGDPRATKTARERKVDVELLVHPRGVGGAAIKGEATFVVP